ncbi:LysR substrate-binding domain-containing protein [Thiofilum flexile]|uniref:LysR substrate-binding domain-containing protein n=1 Tax=Thiofilum flexile TaxID=125627 RepID=UPI0024809E9E|nr:LysR substrate-binding domain-containing protein [Thiofilum flexile]
MGSAATSYASCDIRFGDHLQENRVARQLLAPFKEGLYVSAGYVERYGLPQSPEELSQHRLIGYRFITAKRILPLILNNQGEELTVQMPHSIITNDIEVIADGVRQHLGIGRLFVPVHARLPDRDSFIPVLEPYWRNYPGVYLYYLQNSQKAGRIRTVINFLLEKSII